MGIIPGFAIKNRYFDDLCDAQEGMRIVLQESASVVIDYVAVGGMGCSEVCANAAFAAASMNMPFLSYECNGRELSDEVAYAGFTRMGTPLHTLDMLERIVAMYGWRQVTIVSADPAKYRPQVEYYQKGLLAAGVATAYLSSFDTTFDETLAMVSSFVADKDRVILMIGDEKFMRRVVCGSRVADANLLAVQPTCTGVAVSESFQGAINFAGLGKALPSEKDLPLDCFEGETSETFLATLDQHLTDGYPTAGDNETQVARPHMELRAHAADGVCALAKTMAHFMQSYTAEEMRNPSTQQYQEFVGYLRLA